MRRMWNSQTRTSRRAENFLLRPRLAGSSMSNGARAVAITVTLALGASGCTWWGEQNRTTKGAAYGTGAGAAAGAAIGAILGGGEGAWKGAAIGAAVGGLSGTAVGYYLDKQKKEMEEVLARQD